MRGRARGGKGERGCGRMRADGPREQGQGRAGGRLYGAPSAEAAAMAARNPAGDHRRSWVSGRQGVAAAMAERRAGRRSWLPC